MKKDYTPSPIDTSGISLPKELLELAEVLAENTHDVWAKGRMDDGWTFGPVRNDDLRQHPCLVHYSELSENEKEYDRNTSIETLKVVKKLGWIIEKH